MKGLDGSEYERPSYIRSIALLKMPIPRLLIYFWGVLPALYGILESN